MASLSTRWLATFAILVSTGCGLDEVSCEEQADSTHCDDNPECQWIVADVGCNGSMNETGCYPTSCDQCAEGASCGPFSSGDGHGGCVNAVHCLGGD